MAFSLNTRKINGVIIFDMQGKLAIGEPVLLFRNTIRRFMEDGNCKFILNLAGVSKIDSTGMGELITSFASLKNRQGDVKLLNLTKSTKDLLQITKLLTVFDSYDDEAQAIAASQ
jgi:anti-sigma B factor antagonist